LKPKRFKSLFVGKAENMADTLEILERVKRIENILDGLAKKELEKNISLFVVLFYFFLYKF